MDIEEKNMHEYFEQIKGFIATSSLNCSNIQQVNEFHLNQRECFFLFDYGQNEIICKQGFQNVLGYHNDEINTILISNILHPNEAEIVNRVLRAAITYCFEYPKKSSNNFLTIKYRLKKKDGTYINILNQSSIYNVDEENKMRVALVKFTDISFLGNDEQIKWDFKATNLDETAFKELINKVYKDFFTKREIEIIININKDFDNKLIGKNLNISYHTVAQHRKNILRKANCHNASELILFCKEMGII